MTNEKIKIEDDYLTQEEFDKIQYLMLKSEDFPWFLNEDPSQQVFHFTHIFYMNLVPTSDLMKSLSPLLSALDSFSIFRIKANLLVKTPSIIENIFHSDLSDVLREDQLKQWTTSIFYLNTNNGYTKFENGTKVESVANRMLSFPSGMKHTGTTCTDEAVRALINFAHFT